MYRGNFNYYNVSYRKDPSSDKALRVTGEVKNASGANYSMAVFRITLYIQNKAVASGLVRIAGLAHNMTKSFETMVESIEVIDARLVSRINRCDIAFEGGY